MFVLLGWRVHADQKHLHGKQHSSRHGNQQWRVRSGLRIFSCFSWRFRPPRSSVNNGIPPHVQETSPFLNWSQWACNLLSGQFCFLESHAVGWCTVLYDIIPVHTWYSTVHSKIMINMHLIFWLQLCKSIHAHTNDREYYSGDTLLATEGDPSYFLRHRKLSQGQLTEVQPFYIKLIYLLLMAQPHHSMP